MMGLIGCWVSRVADCSEHGFGTFMGSLRASPGPMKRPVDTHFTPIHALCLPISGDHTHSPPSSRESPASAAHELKQTYQATPCHMSLHRPPLDPVLSYPLVSSRLVTYPLLILLRPFSHMLPPFPLASLPHLSSSPAHLSVRV